MAAIRVRAVHNPRTPIPAGRTEFEAPLTQFGILAGVGLSPALVGQCWKGRVAEAGKQVP